LQPVSIVSVNFFPIEGSQDQVKLKGSEKGGKFNRKLGDLSGMSRTRQKK
jgi:hypothetical protein